jgi:hypothetical protein
VREATGKKVEYIVCITKRSFGRRTYGCKLGSCGLRQRPIYGYCKYVNQYVDSKNILAV